MDVISINKSSLAAAVSPLGTSMSEKQIKLLWSMSKNPTLCFDGDIAGKTAAWRLIKKVIPMITVGYEINFAWLPKGTDPDEMIQKNLSYMWLTKRFKLTVSLELRIYVRIKNENIGELKDYDP